MADFFVDNTATGANDGSSWTDAFTDFADAVTAAASTGGDNIYVAHTYVFPTIPAGYNYAFSTDRRNLTRILSADPADSSLTVGAELEGSSTITISGSAYFYGINIKNRGPGPTRINNVGNTDFMYFRDCFIDHDSTSSSASARVDLGSSVNSGRTEVELVFDNTQIKIDQQNRPITINGAIVRWKNTSPALMSGGAATIDAVLQPNPGTEIELINCDFTGTTINIALIRPTNTLPMVRWGIFNCKFDTGVSLFSDALLTADKHFDMMAVDNEFGGTRDAYFREYSDGTIEADTSVTRTGGAQDQLNTAYSLKVTPNSRPGYVHGMKLQTLPFHIDSTGSKTIEVEFIRDSLTNLTDLDIYMELSYADTSGSVFYSVDNGLQIDPTATGTDHPASTETWTNSMTNPNRQKLSATVTVNRVGPAYLTIFVTIPSTVIFIDPKVEVS